MSHNSVNAYLSYLTVQGFLLTTVYFLSASLVTWVALLSPKSAVAAAGSGPYVPPLFAGNAVASMAWIGFVRATQLIWSISLAFQVVLVTLYWVLLAQRMDSAIETYRNVESHGMKLVYLYLDFLLLGANRPVDRHGIMAFLAALGYLCWNIAFTFTIGPYVYPVMTWRGSGSVILALGAIAFICFAYYCVAMPLAVLRDVLAARVNGTVHSAAACCCYRCGTSLAPSSSAGAAVGTSRIRDASEMKAEDDEQAAWDTVYPLTFVDDHLAFPCSSCACCQSRSIHLCGDARVLGMNSDSVGIATPSGPPDATGQAKL